MNAIKPEKKNLAADLLAGLTFALVNIPQSMAHALLATVNPVFGLYTLMLATPVGALFTSAVFMNVSTTSALAVAAGDTLASYPSDIRPAALATLVLLIGAFQIILGLLRMGWVTRFIPFSVMTGFMTGVAALIILGQIGDFTGYYSSYKGKIAQLADLVLHKELIAWATLAIGLLTIALIYVLSRTRLAKFALILALVLASGVALLFNQLLGAEIRLVGDIADVPGMLPSLALPSVKYIVPLMLPAITIGIIGLVQGAGVSQTFPNPDGKYSDISRDFLGQGAANVATSLRARHPCRRLQLGNGVDGQRWSAHALGKHFCRAGGGGDRIDLRQPGRAGSHAGSGRTGDCRRRANDQRKQHPHGVADESNRTPDHADYFWFHAGHAVAVCRAAWRGFITDLVHLPAI